MEETTKIKKISDQTKYTAALKEHSITILSNSETVKIATTGGNSVIVDYADGEEVCNQMQIAINQLAGKELPLVFQRNVRTDYTYHGCSASIVWKKMWYNIW
ncbi:MAG: hypothetical protein JKX76_02040 [Colwellia sp.]|nr:hypothetical protein [Colwellia sp.]